MTITDAPPLLVRTQAQYEIALAYGRGTNGPQIAQELGADPAAVNSVIEAVGYDRGRARTAAVEYDRRRAAVAAAKGQPSGRAADLPITPPEPEVVVERRADVPLTRPVPVDELLARADRAGIQRARSLAAKVRAYAVDLAAVLDRHEAEEAARQLVAQRRRELDEAEEALKALRSAAARAVPAARSADPARHSGLDGVARAEIRTWAKRAGVPCADNGKIPARVIEMYRQANT